MASIFRRGRRGTWWIKYRVGERQIHHSLHTTNERVAITTKRRVEAEMTTGQLVAPSHISLPEFLGDFCRYLSTRRTRKSYSADCSSLRVFFGPICPALQLGSNTNQPYRNDKSARIEDRMRSFHVPAKYLEDVTPALIEGFITRRILESGIAPKTANRYREILHVMFNYAIRTRNFASLDRR